MKTKIGTLFGLALLLAIGVIATLLALGVFTASKVSVTNTSSDDSVSEMVRDAAPAINPMEPQVSMTKSDEIVSGQAMFSLKNGVLPSAPFLVGADATLIVTLSIPDFLSSNGTITDGHITDGGVSVSFSTITKAGYNFDPSANIDGTTIRNVSFTATMTASSEGKFTTINNDGKVLNTMTLWLLDDGHSGGDGNIVTSRPEVSTAGEWAAWFAETMDENPSFTMANLFDDSSLAGVLWAWNHRGVVGDTPQIVF